MKQLNNRQIEMHLKSAVDALTPNVLDRIDLSVHRYSYRTRSGRIRQ